MEKYSYTVQKQQDGGHLVVLKRNSDSAEKTFYFANNVGSYEGIVSHMESLTDIQCEGFFPKERKQK